MYLFYLNVADEICIANHGLDCDVRESQRLPKKQELSEKEEEEEEEGESYQEHLLNIFCVC